MNIYPTSDFILRMPNPRADYRLFFFPYAGGGASIGEQYYKLFLPDIDFVAIQLPGRENRIAEEPYMNMSVLVEDIVTSIIPYLDMPFVFWGHCSGALIAFELVNRIQQLINIQPHLLLVSACATPEIASSCLPVVFHKLSDSELFVEVQKLMRGHFVGDDNSKIVKILLPGIRADFSVYETYQYNNDSTLSCPIFTFGGEKDHIVEEKDLIRWKCQTTGNFDYKCLPGQGHYFINNCAIELTKMIKKLIL
jgi:medium-chain acyl-[acyl-carrier-protein] hydrolase